MSSRSAIRRLTGEECLARGVSRETLENPWFVPVVAEPDAPEAFDPTFFGLTVRDALVLDPQVRLLLECAWEGLESAGIAPGDPAHTVGICVGGMMSSYLLQHVIPHMQALGLLEPVQLLMGGAPDFMASRLARCLDARGPALTVQTACATSLLAIHLACEQLQLGTCDVMIAGGTSFNAAARAGYKATPGGMHSISGRLAPFDRRADGTVFGSGTGVVVLRRLDDALAAGDNLLGVILSSSTSSDGAGASGFLAPGVEGQARAMRQCLERGAIAADSVGYLLAHGTGTLLGDPLEAEALARVFGDGSRKNRAALGSIKPNVGHLDAAAGVASLLGALEILRQGVLPPLHHFEQLHPSIDPQLPLEILQEARPFERGSTPRRVGVSCAGMGGINVFVVLEEAPEVTRGGFSSSPETRHAPPPVGDLSVSSPASPGALEADHSGEAWQIDEGGPRLVVLSAQTPTALSAARAQLAAFLRANPRHSLTDVAHTLQVGRCQQPVRWWAVVDSITNLIEQLEQPFAPQSTNPPGEFQPVIWPPARLRKELLTTYFERVPVFRDAWLEAVSKLPPSLPAAALEAAANPGTLVDACLVDDASSVGMEELADFVVGWSMARLWQALGVDMTRVVGFEMGGVVAAAITGDLHGDALQKTLLSRVEARTRLGQAYGRLFMVEPEFLLERLPEGARLWGALEARCRLVVGSRAALSELQIRLLGVVDSVVYPARIPLHPDVLMEGCCGRRLSSSGYVLELVGGGALGLLRWLRGGLFERCLISRAELEPLTGLLWQVGEAWSRGLTVAWSALPAVKGRRIPLPGSCFERANYYLPAVPIDSLQTRSDGGRQHLGAEADPRRAPDASQSQRVLESLRRHLGALPADRDTTLERLGLDSLAAAQLRLELQGWVRGEPPAVERLLEFTPSALLAWVEGHSRG